MKVNAATRLFLKTATSMAVLSLILAACNLTDVPTKETPESTPTEPVATETVTVTATPRVETATPFLKPTETKVPTAIGTRTPEATKVVESKILLKETVEYAGRKFDFEITIPTGDKMMLETFENYGITGFAINEEKPKAREILAKTLSFSFLNAYNYQNKKSVSLEVFMKNPEKYPVKIKLRDAEGKLTEQTMTLDKIKSFEMRYSSGLKGELIMTFPSQSSYSYGYGFESGKFVFYTPLSPRDNQVELALKYKETMPKDAPIRVGYAVDFLAMETAMMPYTLTDNKELNTITNPIITEINKIAERVFPGKMTMVEGIAWLYSHTFFTAKLK